MTAVTCLTELAAYQVRRVAKITSTEKIPVTSQNGHLKQQTSGGTILSMQTISVVLDATHQSQSESGPPPIMCLIGIFNYGLKKAIYHTFHSIATSLTLGNVFRALLFGSRCIDYTIFALQK